MKYAVYVEGLSELLFVADVLQKYSNYNSGQCGFLCVNLNADKYDRMNSPKQGNIHSVNYYQIVNVNNDNRVLSKLNKDIPGLIEQGYNVIIGLKDVFGDAYERLMKNQPVIDRTRIEQLYKIQTSNLKTEGSDCRLHYAIMEYEAWMLALIENYITDKNQDINTISQELGVDIRNCNPEDSIYHPFPMARKIYQACGEDYRKHGKESYSFLSTLSVDDYERLRQSGRCASFGKFLDSLLGGACPQLP